MTRKLTVTTLLYQHFELLDVFGPLEMFGMLGDRFALALVSETGGAVKSNQGPVVQADYDFSNDFTTDILIVPGGWGAMHEVNNKRLIDWLSMRCRDTPTVASVGTGAALLAKTGSLDGRNATANKLDFQWVMSQGPNVRWVPDARWVEDGKYFTASSISAAIDMSLALVAKFCGEHALPGPG